MYLDIGLGLAKVPDYSLQLSPGVSDIGQGNEGDPVHGPEVGPQDFVGVVVRYYPELLKLIEVKVAACYLINSIKNKRGNMLVMTKAYYELIVSLS